MEIISYQSELITFTNSNIIFGTSFMNGADIYNKLIENTQIISQSFGGIIGTDGYAEGYSKANAYVLIPGISISNRR